MYWYCFDISEVLQYCYYELNVESHYHRVSLPELLRWWDLGCSFHTIFKTAISGIEAYWFIIMVKVETDNFGLQNYVHHFLGPKRYFFDEFDTSLTPVNAFAHLYWKSCPVPFRASSITLVIFHCVAIQLSWLKISYDLSVGNYHRPHNLDLVPSDYHLFFHLKRSFRLTVFCSC